MPTPRGSIVAAVDANAIYVVGGNGSQLRLTTVEKYVPATNTWTEEAPLLVGKSEPSAGLLGTKIVAAGGYTTSGDTGDNEAYNVSTNVWSAVASDPTPRNASCGGALLGQLYTAGGINSSVPQTSVKVNESYSATTNKWTTQLAMPVAALWQASAVANGQLYCVGGQTTFQGTAMTNVQIFQP
jgi:N-acetylneuraminic acid mutarotase